MSFTSFGKVVRRLKFHMNHTFVIRDLIASSYLSTEFDAFFFYSNKYKTHKIYKFPVFALQIVSLCVCVSMCMYIRFCDESVCYIFIDFLLVKTLVLLFTQTNLISQPKLLNNVNIYSHEKKLNHLLILFFLSFVAVYKSILMRKNSQIDSTFFNLIIFAEFFFFISLTHFNSN